MSLPHPNVHQDTASPATAARVQLHWPLISGLGSLALGALLGLVVLLRGNVPLDVDAEWMEEIVEHRNPFWEVPSFVLNYVGSGWATTVIALALGVVLIVRGRPNSALYLVAAVVVSSLVVQGLKALFGRVRPDDIMLALDSASFPSGHVANAATIAAVIAVLAWRWWVVAAGAGYVILMALSRTYLGAHWVSDTVGGLLIGAGVAVVVWAPFAFRVLRERRGEKPATPTSSGL